MNQIPISAEFDGGDRLLNYNDSNAEGVAGVELAYYASSRSVPISFVYNTTTNVITFTFGDGTTSTVTATRT